MTAVKHSALSDIWYHFCRMTEDNIDVTQGRLIAANTAGLDEAVADLRQFYCRDASVQPTPKTNDTVKVVRPDFFYGGRTTLDDWLNQLMIFFNEGITRDSGKPSPHRLTLGDRPNSGFDHVYKKSLLLTKTPKES